MDLFLILKASNQGVIFRKFKLYIENCIFPSSVVGLDELYLRSENVWRATTGKPPRLLTRLAKVTMPTAHAALLLLVTFHCSRLFFDCFLTCKCFRFKNPNEHL